MSAKSAAKCFCGSASARLLGFAALEAGRWPLLLSEGSLEGRSIGVEARPPGVLGGTEAGKLVETGVPPCGVSRRGTRRGLVNEDEAGPTGVGRELEAQRLFTPGECE